MTYTYGHALLIGIGSYAHMPQLNVPITTADANAVAVVLCDPQYCGYPPAQITLLTDAAANSKGILAALDVLATQTGEDDTVFIFYAGHGAYGDDGYYLTTHDSQLADSKVVSGSGLREAELINKLRAIKAKRLLLIINACHSGEISPVLAPGEQPLTGVPIPPQVSAALLGTGEGRVIISACRESQYAFIGPGPLTFFTQALVDGLQGKGVSSNRGYISLFDLYTHLYFALDGAVPRAVPAAVRQRYGEKQEPELTILKGIGPFAIALWRGATTLGTFDGSGGAPEDTAVREVNPAYSQVMLRQHRQNIGSNARVGAAIAGDVYGGVNVTRPGDTIDTGGGNNIRTANAGSSSIAIGRGAQSTVRHVNTGGGDYVEGNVDKRKDSFVSGDQFTMSGNFSGAILNIKSTLMKASQSISTVSTGEVGTKAQLQVLLEQLNAELQKVPAEKISEAEAVAQMAKVAVEQITKQQPNKTLVQVSTEGLKQTAQNLVMVLPEVLPLAERISEAIRKISGM